MVDLLRRALAPVTTEAWKEIDEQASRILKTHLTARGLVDFDGPHGWEMAAVNTGELEFREAAGIAPPWGLRRVLPLLEVRVPFHLAQMELDSVSRGNKTIDLGPLDEAARRLAMFEESAIYNGFPEAQIEGILPSSPHDAIPLPSDSQATPQAIAVAVRELQLAGVEGPFTLVLGPRTWSALMQAAACGYPTRQIVRELIGGEILLSAALEGGVILSTAGGNFALTVGQDLAIGYAHHDRQQVELFLTESFTFRPLQPEAAIVLTPPAA